MEALGSDVGGFFGVAASPVFFCVIAFGVMHKNCKSNGSILELRNCISLRYNFYGGWRKVKLLSSGELKIAEYR